MLQIPEIIPPPLGPKPHPLFHQPRAPLPVQPAAPAAGQPRRQRQPKIWDLLPTPKAPEKSSSGFWPERTPGFPRRPSDRSVKCYALHVRNRSLCVNQTALQDSSALKETADLQNESSSKPWTGITSPRQGFRAIGVPKVLGNLPANFREAAVDSAGKFNDIKAFNAVQEAAGNGHFWKNDEHNKSGGLSVSARFASSGVACNETADGGEVPYNEASHSEPEASRWAVTPQAPEIARQAAGIALQGRVLLACEAREMEQRRMQQEKTQRERMQQRRTQFRAYREAPICAADLNELLTAVLGIFSDASSDKPSKSSWFWRLISEEEEEQGAGEGGDGNAAQRGKVGSGRFGSPAGVLEYIGFDDDEDEED
ncbi:unnamed protein product [Closterium sp. Yama58-4]|nr:unnamed protein product [Closterium sp. Yama58-4]